ncbi:VOC family protein [Brachybacterium sp. GCM10030267]|uniref:VOC family protein n=1 Tax=unclassified Brachybacterium TaxID=2623841 RepID=UPI0036087C07
MQLAATRIITDDVDRLVAFYEQITEVAATRLHPLFAELRTDTGTLAIASSQTAPLLAGAVRAGANHSVTFDLLVADVEAAYARLQGIVATFVQEPTTMPWGNRSLLFHDPDGNLVNVFSPVGTQAQERIGQ